MALQLAGCAGDAKVSIEIIPDVTTVVMGATEKFVCTVTIETSSSYTVDSNRSASMWSIDEAPAGGTLSDDVASSVFKVYTPASAGEFHVTCASNDDPEEARATATVMVVAP